MQNSLISVRDLFNQLINSLRKVYDTSEARQLALILFDHYAGIGTKEMIISPKAVMEDRTVRMILDAAERLLNQEPVQYITGISHFCGSEFFVNPDVLIPRQETEELVRWILEDHAHRHFLKIADIGTGSGCIAISLWLRFQDAEVHAFEHSEPALKVAAQNNAELRAGVIFHQINFMNRSEWPDAKFDIIVSNPPYIPIKNKELLPLNVSEFEPPLALFVPDNDPLIFYNLLAEFSETNLNSTGFLYVEMHENYADQVSEVFAGNGLPNRDIRLDMNGRKRMLRACR